MADNYYPNRQKNSIDIPDFLEKRIPPKPDSFPMPEPISYTEEAVAGLNNALEQAQEEKKSNAWHLKELDKVADAYSEDEARVIVKRIVSNYPEVVLGEVAGLIRDMQELSGAILKSSKNFATRRGEL